MAGLTGPATSPPDAAAEAGSAGVPTLDRSDGVSWETGVGARVGSLAPTTGGASLGHHNAQPVAAKVVTRPHNNAGFVREESAGSLITRVSLLVGHSLRRNRSLEQAQVDRDFGRARCRTGGSIDTTSPPID